MKSKIYLYVILAIVSVFNRVSAQHISGFNPSFACTGFGITIKGSGFTGASSVSFGGIPVEQYQVVSDSEIIAQVGKGGIGPIKIEVPGSSIYSKFPFKTTNNAMLCLLYMNKSKRALQLRNVERHIDEGQIPVTGNVSSLVVSPNQERVYVQSDSYDYIEVLNLENKELENILKIGFTASGMQISPDGKWLYLTSKIDSSFGVFDLNTNQMVYLTNIGSEPDRMILSLDGKYLFIQQRNSEILIINTYNYGTMNTLYTHSTMGKMISSIDGKKVYVGLLDRNLIAQINTQTFQFDTLYNASDTAYYLSEYADGTKLFYANKEDTVLHEINFSTNQTNAYPIEGKIRGLETIHKLNKVLICHEVYAALYAYPGFLTNNSRYVFSVYAESLNGNIGFDYFDRCLPEITQVTPSVITEIDTVNIVGKNLGGLTGITLKGIPPRWYKIVNDTLVRAIFINSDSGDLIVRRNADSALYAGIVYNGKRFYRLTPSLACDNDTVLLYGKNLGNVTSALFSNMAVEIIAAASDSIKLLVNGHKSGKVEVVVANDTLDTQLYFSKGESISFQVVGFNIARNSSALYFINSLTGQRSDSITTPIFQNSYDDGYANSEDGSEFFIFSDEFLQFNSSSKKISRFFDYESFSRNKNFPRPSTAVLFKNILTKLYYNPYLETIDTFKVNINDISTVTFSPDNRYMIFMLDNNITFYDFKYNRIVSTVYDNSTGIVPTLKRIRASKRNNLLFAFNDAIWNSNSNNDSVIFCFSYTNKKFLRYLNVREKINDIIVNEAENALYVVTKQNKIKAYAIPSMTMLNTININKRINKIRLWPNNELMVHYQGDTTGYIISQINHGLIRTIPLMGTIYNYLVPKNNFLRKCTPKINAISESSAFVGDSLYIIGSDLSQINAITFGDTITQEFKILSDDSILVIVPKSNNGRIVINSNNGIDSISGFQCKIVEVDSISPTAGCSGTLVTIYGKGFNFVSRIALGNDTISQFQAKTNNQISFISSTSSSGRVFLYVNNKWITSKNFFVSAGRVENYALFYSTITPKMYLCNLEPYYVVDSLTFTPIASFTRFVRAGRYIYIFQNDTIDIYYTHKLQLKKRMVVNGEISNLITGKSGAYIYVSYDSLNYQNLAVIDVNEFKIIKVVCLGFSSSHSLRNMSSNENFFLLKNEKIYDLRKNAFLQPRLKFPPSFSNYNGFFGSNDCVIFTDDWSSFNFYKYNVKLDEVTAYERIGNHQLHLLSEKHDFALWSNYNGNSQQLEFGIIEEGKFKIRNTGVFLNRSLSYINYYPDESCFLVTNYPINQYVVQKLYKYSLDNFQLLDTLLTYNAALFLGSVKAEIPCPSIIEKFVPNHGRVGDTILVYGKNFSGVNQASLGNVAVSRLEVLSDTVLRVKVGLGNSGNLALRDNYHTVYKSGFTYDGLYIDDFSPKNSCVIDTIHISGLGFNKVNYVSIGGVSNSNYTIVNDSLIKLIPNVGVNGEIKLASTTDTAVASENYSEFSKSKERVCLVNKLNTDLFYLSISNSVKQKRKNAGLGINSVYISKTNKLAYIMKSDSSIIEVVDYLNFNTTEKYSLASRPLAFVVNEKKMRLYVIHDYSLAVYSMVTKNLLFQTVLSERPDNLILNPVGDLLYVFGQNMSMINIYKEIDGVLTGIINTGFGVSGITFGSRGAYLYYINSINGKLVKVDCSTWTFSSELQLTTGLHTILLSKNGNSLYITSTTFNSLFIIDAKSLVESSRVMNLPGASKMFYSSNFNGLFVLCSNLSQLQLVSLATNQVLNTFAIPAGYDLANTSVVNIPYPCSKQFISFSPSSGKLLDTITLVGKNLLEAVSVKFGNVNALQFWPESDTVLKALVGNGMTGDVAIGFDDDILTLPGFIYTGTFINNFLPLSACKGDVIKINGRSLNHVTSVFVGMNRVSSFQIISDSLIEFVLEYGFSGQISLVTPFDTILSSQHLLVGKDMKEILILNDFGKNECRELFLSSLTANNIKSFPPNIVDIVYSKDSFKAYALVKNNGNINLIEVNLETTNQRVIASLSINCSRLVLNKEENVIACLDTSSNALKLIELNSTVNISTLSVGSIPNDLIFSNFTNHLYVLCSGTNQIIEFDYQNKFYVNSIQIPSNASKMYESKDGRRLIINCPLSDYLINLDLHNSTYRNLYVGNRSGIMKISHGDGYLYTISKDDSSIVRYNISLNMPVDSFYIGDLPSNIDFSLDGSKLYMLCPNIDKFKEYELSSKLLIRSSNYGRYLAYGDKFVFYRGTSCSPVLLQFTPTSAGIFETVYLKGNYFTSGYKVAFNGFPAAELKILSDSTASAIVLDGQSGDVKISTLSGSSSLAGFQYKSMYISDFNPKFICGGGRVTVKGRGFVSNAPSGGVKIYGFPNVVTVVNDSVLYMDILNNPFFNYGNNFSLYPPNSIYRNHYGQHNLYFANGIKRYGILPDITGSNVWIINLDSNRIVDTIKNILGVHSIALFPNGYQFNIKDLFSNYLYDLSKIGNKPVSIVNSMSVGNSINGLQVDKSYNFLYFASYNDNLVYTRLFNSVNPFIINRPTGKGPINVHPSFQPLSWYTVNKIDCNVSYNYSTSLSLSSIEHSPHMGFTPANSAITRDNRKIYIAADSLSFIGVYLPSSKSIVKRVYLSSPQKMMVMSPVDDKLYTVSAARDKLSIIDTEADTVIQELSIQGSPSAMCFNPEGTILYIMCGVSGMLKSFNPINMSLINQLYIGPSAPFTGNFVGDFINYHCTYPVSVSELDSFKLVVYPNPTSNEFTIRASLPVGENYELVLLDNTGRVVKQLESTISSESELNRTFSSREFASGLYLLKLISSSKEQSIPLSIQH